MTNSILFVDLDGTLVATDTLWESVIIYLKRNPLRIFQLLIWLLKGKVYFKNRLAEKADLDPATLPYRDEVLKYIRESQTAGSTVILATAAPRRIAESVGGHLKLFSKVLATDGQTNLAGAHKLKAIQENTNDHSFQYIGDAAADLPIWEAAETAIVVDPSGSLLRRMNRFPGVKVISSGEKEKKLRTWIKALRVHQWSKNLLLFIPLLMAHRVSDILGFSNLIIAFLSFSFCASAVYILNDLLDLESDRQHPTKKYRPFAAGILPIKSGLIASIIMLMGSGWLSLTFLPDYFTFCLGFYFLLTTGYSIYLKRQPIVDVLTLSGLYAFRIFAGALAVTVPISFWLLTFSMFFFLSLALLKRYTDLLNLNGGKKVNGRGYIIRDINIVLITGIVCGFLSLLVFSLYINSDHVRGLYSSPALLWLIVPCLMYWITRMWLVSHRGNMHDDPIVFALKDRLTYILIVIIGVLLLGAASLKDITFLKNILIM
jgi:4-hydroxybenzoate polyprenyltransferase